MLDSERIQGAGSALANQTVLRNLRTGILPVLNRSSESTPIGPRKTLTPMPTGN